MAGENMQEATRFSEGVRGKFYRAKSGAALLNSRSAFNVL